MSQHTYTLKFTIKSAYDSIKGKSPYSSTTRDTDTAEDITIEDSKGKTKEDRIKAEVEKRIKEAISTFHGGAHVVFNSLTES